jgi:hypothetical protein
MVVRRGVLDMKSKFLVLWQDERGQDSVEVAIAIAFLGLGSLLVIRSAFGNRLLAFATIILAPDDPLAGTIDVKAKQIVIDALQEEGVDVSDSSVASDIETFVQAVIIVNIAWPNLIHVLDAILARFRPRGHIEKILDGTAKDVGMSTASFRRRQSKYSSDAKPAPAAPGIFERLREEAVKSYAEKQAEDLCLGGHPNPAIEGQLKTGHSE